MEIFKKDGEQMELLDEKIDDVVASAPSAHTKIYK